MYGTIQLTLYPGDFTHLNYHQSLTCYLHQSLTLQQSPLLQPPPQPLLLPVPLRPLPWISLLTLVTPLQWPFCQIHYLTSAGNCCPIDLSGRYKKPWRSPLESSPVKTKWISSLRSIITLATFPLRPTPGSLGCRTLQKGTMSGRSWSTCDAMTFIGF